MLPQQRNEATIENAIERVRKVLNAAENSNQAGEDLIVVMALGSELYEASRELVDTHADTKGWDFTGLCLKLADKVHALDAVLSKAEGK